MIYNKRGSTDETALMIYRIVFVTIIAFVILGVSSVVYNYAIKTQNTEGMLLGRVVLDCITEEGPIDLVSLGEFKEDMFSYCGITAPEDYAFISLKFYDSGGLEFEKITYGDEGLEWVNKIYTNDLGVSSIEEYEPGYFDTKLDIHFIDDGEYSFGTILLEVIINGE